MTPSARAQKNLLHALLLWEILGRYASASGHCFPHRSAEKQFLVTTGDNVYANGLEEEYRTNLFPYYLSPEPNRGASLMSKIPFYMVLGNHDVRADSIDKDPSTFAYFYYSDLPLNAPVTERAVTIKGNSELVKAFKKNTKPRFPGISNFSFDYGNVHMVCLDANDYVNPLDPLLVTWLREDLGKSTADWKMVTFHAPGFNSSIAHYEYQLMRLLSPLFEELGVNWSLQAMSIIINGAFHCYLLPRQMKQETDISSHLREKLKAHLSWTRYSMVSIRQNLKVLFTLLRVRAVLRFTIQDSAKSLRYGNMNQRKIGHTSRKNSFRQHSFTLIETKGKILTLQQIDLTGKVIDEIKVTR